MQQFFSIVALINSEHTCIFQKGFCTLYFGTKENNVVTFRHISQIKHAFLGKIKEMTKKNKLPLGKKIALELLHQRLGHIFTRSLLAGDVANVWEDIELRVVPDPFVHHVKFLQ